MTWRSCAAQGPTPGLLRGAAWGVAGLALATGGAFAAEDAKSGASDVIFLAQLITLMVVGRLLGEAMNRIGQPSVMGMLLGGVLLGPSMLGALWPDLQHALFPRTAEQKAMLDGVSQFGILLLLLLTGMETDLKLVRKVGKAALSISLTGVAVPFLCGFALGQFMPEALLPHPDQRLLTSLFLGTALSISSIKIVAAVVREMGFTRRDLGQIIVASAICEDSIGWVIIAITLSLAQSGSVDLLDVGRAVLGTAAFLIASFTIGRPLVFFLIRWTNDNFESDFPVITTILVIMGLMALTTHFIGVHTVLGAFVAGVLIGKSPILTKHIDEQLRGLILAFFMPVFFGIAGLSADLTVLKDPNPAVHGAGPDRDCHARQVRRRLHRRRNRRTGPPRIVRARVRHECARLDRGDRRHHRALDGRSQPEPVHHDRRDGCRDHHGDAADAALGAGARSPAQSGEGAAGARGIRGPGFRCAISSACWSSPTKARTAGSPPVSLDSWPALAAFPSPSCHRQRQAGARANKNPSRGTEKPRSGSRKR